MSAENRSAEDTFSILIATDNHLGYNEKHPIRGQDSFITFEEILQIGSKNKVDFTLLGGDLFHDSKPSLYCIQKCIELCRKYCLGDNPVSFEFLSDQSYNFQQQSVPIVNYEDPNLNVSIPLFSIHGNHDDPTGHKHTSALDILSSTGLINYFGRWDDLSFVEIRPILLQKGATKLALYGLSHIRDERLGRLFRDGKVQLLKPNEGDWFNILVLHQNRAARSVKNFIPESALPNFIDLVIWGHEHECRIEPEAVNDIYISQPGSSVATSLSIGESVPKKVALLHIYKKEFKLTPIPLKTVRPFIMSDMVLEDPKSSDYYLEKPGEQAVQQVKEKIQSMIEEANSNRSDLSKPLPAPLLRLKVYYYNDQQQFNPIRIGMQFGNKIANSDDVIKLCSLEAKERNKKVTDLDEDDYEIFNNIQEYATSIEDIILKYFEGGNAKKLSVISAKDLTEAVVKCVKHNDDAIECYLDKHFKQTVKEIQNMDIGIDEIDNRIELLRDQREENQKSSNGRAPCNNTLDVDDDELPTISKPSTSGSKQKRSAQVIDISDDEDNMMVTKIKDELGSDISESDELFDNLDLKPKEPQRGRGSRGRGRGASRPRARGSRGSRGKKNTGNYSKLDDFF